MIRSRSIAIAVLVVGPLACRREQTPPSPAPSAERAEASEPKSPSSSFDEGPFRLAIVPVGDYVAGQPGRVEVTLSPKGEYHTNDKYPYKFKVVEAPGVKFPAPVIGKDKARLEPSQATLTVDFTPESPGEKSVGGQFSFSVCSADRCLVEKRDLILKIAAR